MNYCNNYSKLQKLFATEQPHHTSTNEDHLSDFNIHIKAKVLASLLAKATLATPELNRATVKSLLKGELGWPKIDGEKHYIKDNDIALEVFENLGFLSFYADYCRVHKSRIRDKETLDESVRSFLNALETIQNIIFGEGFVKPHYHISKTCTETVIANLRVNITPDEIPELVATEDHYRIELFYPDNKNLVAEYLWQTFDTLNIEIVDEDSTQADLQNPEFKKWLLISRVYSELSLQEINFDYLGHNSRKCYSAYALKLIASDQQLKKPAYVLKNQYRFESHLQQTLIKRFQTYKIKTDIDSLNSSSSIKEDRPPKALSIDELQTQYILKDSAEPQSDLEFLWKYCHIDRQYPSYHFGFYYSFIKRVAESDIYVLSHTVDNHGGLDKLRELSKTRTELRLLLLRALPSIRNIDYLLYLLNDRDTCCAAVYLLTNRINSIPEELINNSASSLHRIIFPTICDELFSVYFKNNSPKNPIDLTQLLIMLAKMSITESYKGEPLRNKDCLDILLEKLTAEQITCIAETLCDALENGDSDNINFLPDWKLYLLFWLLEKTQDCDLCAEVELEARIQKTITSIYTTKFIADQDGDSRSFGACHFIDYLPWWRINKTYLAELLTLIPKPAHWFMKLNAEDVQGYENKKLTESYFQLLLCLHSKDREPSDNQKIIDKILELLNSCGFFEDDQIYIGLFDRPFLDSYDLWGKFTAFIDYVDDEAFNRIVNVINTGMPIKNVLALYNQTNKASRKDILIKHIEGIQEDTFNDLDLNSIEESLDIACRSGALAVAERLLNAGLSLIHDPESYLNQRLNANRLGKFKNDWIAHEYKVKLLLIANDETLEATDKLERLNGPDTPFLKERTHHLKSQLYKSCDRFRRKMTGYVRYEDAPEDSYLIFDRLYKEEHDLQHSGNRFAAKIALLDSTDSSAANYRGALVEWQDTIDSDEIHQIPKEFIQNWLHCLSKINDHVGIDQLWSKLNDSQKNTIKVATYYCQSLKARGYHYSTQLIFDGLKKYHNIEVLDDESENELRELNDLIMSGLEPQTVAVLSKHLAEKGRTNDELRRSYQEIFSKDITDQISIIRSKNMTFEQFLYEQLLSIVQEIQTRKANLNTLREDTDRTSYKIIQEDPINDWVTSLFNKMHGYMSLKCSDQARGGYSENGKNPGEIDFFISDKHNDRRAIMEAFRLFSHDNTVITKHLNKVAGYDQECLSPVIILAYCDVVDFDSLCTKYEDNIQAMDYSGFSRSTKNNEQLRIKKSSESSSTIKTYAEIRYRGDKPITIFHFMINLRKDG